MVMVLLRLIKKRDLKSATHFFGESIRSLQSRPQFTYEVRGT